MQTEGWPGMEPAERAALGAIVRSITRSFFGMNLCEIGSGIGGSARVICTALADAGNPGLLYSIDNRSMDVGKVARQSGGLTQSQMLERTAAECPNVRFLTGDYQSWIGRPDEDLAFLLIDGDHRYQAVRADLTVAPCIQRGGFLVLHDVGKNVHDYGPLRAISEWLAERINWRHYLQVNSLLCLQKIA